MKEFLLYVWQLPQNVVARCVVVFSGAITIGGCNSCIKYCTNCKDIEIFPTSYRFGVSLGKYIIVHFSDCDCTNCKDIEIFSTSYRFGVSLGKYIIVHFSDCDPFTIKHEYGHTEQAKRLGWLYLILIGIPSAIGNIYDRIAHKKWTEYKRKMWYYKQPWEAWANKLAGINIAEEL